MRRIPIITFLLLCISTAAFAQATVKADTPFKVLADHNGVNVSTYSVKIDGIQVGPAMPAATVLSNGVVTLQHPTGVARGAHTAQVCAQNQDNPEVCSVALAFDSKLPPPSAPGNLRFDVSLTASFKLQVNPETGVASIDGLHVGTVVTPQPTQ